jgi:hypothetical protein
MAALTAKLATLASARNLDLAIRALNAAILAA